MTNLELLEKVRDIVITHSEDPADTLIRMGRAFMEIGTALKGRSPAEARAILMAVEVLADANRRPNPKLPP